LEGVIHFSIQLSTTFLVGHSLWLYSSDSDTILCDDEFDGKTSLTNLAYSSK